MMLKKVNPSMNIADLYEESYYSTDDETNLYNKVTITHAYTNDSADEEMPLLDEQDELKNNSANDNDVDDNEMTDNSANDNDVADNDVSDNETTDNSANDNDVADNETTDNSANDNDVADNETTDNSANDNDVADNETTDNSANDNDAADNETTDNSANDNDASSRSSTNSSRSIVKKINTNTSSIIRGRTRSIKKKPSISRSQSPSHSPRQSSSSESRINIKTLLHVKRKDSEKLSKNLEKSEKQHKKEIIYCDAIYKSGKNKGNVCNRPVFNSSSSKCKMHSN
jgi:hypothetical protein